MRRLLVRVGLLSAVASIVVALTQLVPAFLASGSVSGTAPDDLSRELPTSPSVRQQTKGLTPEMRRRVTRALAAADRAGVTLAVESGYRTKARQRMLYDRAVRRYGSAKAARKWVLPPGESSHPLGKAVDIGPSSGAAWLERNGYQYGLCRPYDNESWHFEATTSPGNRCPARTANAG